jgi:formate dehydrogenase assembly factor FdhD
MRYLAVHPLQTLFLHTGKNASNLTSKIATLTLPIFLSISAHTSAALTSIAAIWYV